MDPAFFPDFSEKNGATTLFKSEDSGESSKLPMAIQIKPRLLPKKKADGESRDTRSEFGGPGGKTHEEWGPHDGVNPGLGEPESPGVKQFRFAPLQGPLVPGRPDKAFKLTKPMVSATEFMDTARAPKSGTEFEDSDNLRLVDPKTGFFPEEADPDASLDRSARLMRLLKTRQSWQWGPNQTNMPEPVFLMDAPLEELIYPVAGGLEPVVFAAAPWRFTKPIYIQALDIKPARYAFSTEATGTLEKGEAVYLVRFFLEENPWSQTLVRFDPGYAEVFDYGDVDLKAPFPKDTRAPEDVVEAIVSALQADTKTLAEAAKLIKKSVQGPGGKPVAPPKTGDGQAVDVDRLDNPPMLDQEKVFAKLKGWKGDHLAIGTTALGADDLRVLGEKPQGSGHYFSWVYISQADQAKKFENEVKKKKYSITNADDGVLVVTKLAGWKAVETAAG